MDSTYDVRIYKTDVYRGARTTTYKVRWAVGKKRFKNPFKTAALAESFRSDLVAAARKGEAFRLGDGLPVSLARSNSDLGWYDFACAFVDMKWPRAAATTRRTHAEAMTAVTVAMLADKRGKPDDKLIRKALSRWGFNTAQRQSNCPEEVQTALRWVKNHTHNVSALREPELLRSVLDALALRLDGVPGAPSVVSRRRKILITAMGYAVELGLLECNPIPALKWTPPKTSHVIDRRRVANPVQARTLLNSVREQRRSGPRLVAFFGCLYYAALRPEEAVSLAKHNLSLPQKDGGSCTSNEPNRTRARRGRTAATTATTDSSSNVPGERPGRCPAHPNSPRCCTNTSRSSARLRMGGSSEASATKGSCRSPPSCGRGSVRGWTCSRRR